MPRKKKTTKKKTTRKKRTARKKKTTGVINYDKLIESVDKELKFQVASLEKTGFIPDAVSSGALTTDLIMGGGYAPGTRTALIGPEHSLKTTFVLVGCGGFIRLRIRTNFYDYEGSTVVNRANSLGVKTNWDRERKEKKAVYWRRYDDMDTGEEFFRHARRIMSKLPRRETGSPPIAFVVDSLPAMTPEASVVKTESGGEKESKQAALRAAMFSEQMPRIKLLVRRKRCLWIDTNQIRINPRQMFGNPEYVPGGNAVKHYTDVRIKVRVQSFPNIKKNILVEASYDGNGHDCYTNHKIQIVKSKVFSPFRECMLRSWFEHKGHPGFGIDPVSDVFEFLRITGQMTYNRGRIKIAMKDWPKYLTWLQFKAEVLGGMMRKGKPTGTSDIIKACREQLNNGTAFEMMFNTQGGVIRPEEAEELQAEEEADADDGDGSMNLDSEPARKPRRKKKSVKKKTKKRRGKSTVRRSRARKRQ